MVDPVALASPHIGPISAVEEVNGFVGNRTFRLMTSDETYYFKSSAAASTEARACELARALDVPAPEIVAEGDSWLLSRELRGRAEASTDVLRQAGECMRRVHTVTDPSADWAGRLQGVLDDLGGLPARFSMAGPEAMRAFMDGYGVIETPARTLAAYRVLWSVMALQAEVAAGGDWIRPHLDVIGRELA